jgi:hypothetical protein
MSRLVESVIRAMPPKGNLRRYRVGILFNGNPGLVEQILGLGHRTVVFSNRFHPLYRVYRAYRKVAAASLFDTVMLVETSLDAVPIAPASLDVLLLSNGLTGHGLSSVAVLSDLKRLIKPEGSLIWPERSSDGFWGKVSTATRPFSRRSRGLVPRRDLCRLTMAAGFKDIGQIVIPKKVLPWVVTFGRVGTSPWI